MSLTGRRVSHYVVGEEISRGGMGVVYRATDTRLGRDVALKVLAPEIAANPEARARFLREARAASTLEHPHVAVIYDVGDEQGADFIAMELLAGQSLAALVSEGPLPPERALDLALEIGEALAYAHSRGIVHRDLKPANVLLTTSGRAKVIDFGLAKQVAAQAENAATVVATAPGVLLGTTAYMSPEQARGTVVDARSDIFSFGVLLYELLAGVRPFRGHSGLDILDSVLNTPTPALPIKGLAATNPEGLEITRIVAKCLEKDPAARYQGMSDLLVDLRAVRARLGTSSRSSAAAGATAPMPVAADTAPVARRGWVVPAGLAAAVLVAAVAFLMWPRRSGDTNVSVGGGRPSLAVLYFENNTGSPDLDWLRTGLTDMLVTDLSQSADLEVLSTDRLAQIMRDLGRGDERVVSADLVQEVARRAGVQTVLLGSYVRAGGVIRINLKLQEAHTGRILNAERADAQSEATLFSTVDELTRRLKEWLVAPAATSPLLTRPGSPGDTRPADATLANVTTSSIEAFRLFAEGHDLHNRLREEDALPLMQQAVAVDPDFALAYAKMAVISGNLGRTGERAQYIKAALARLDRLTEPERLYIQAYASSFGPETAPRSIELYEQLLAKYPSHTAARNNVAALYLVLEQYDRATEHYRILFDAGVEFPGSIDGLAHAYTSLGRADDALAAYDEYVRRYPNQPRGHAGRGEILLHAGRLDEAAAAYERALTIEPGLTEARRGQVAASMLAERWDEAAQRARGMQGSTSPNTARWGYKLEGLIALYRGRSAEALRLLERGAVMEGGAEGNNDSASTRGWMAEALIAQGQYAEAMKMADRGIVEAHGNPARFVNLMAKAVAAAASRRTADASQALDALQAVAATSRAPRLARVALLARGRVALAAGDQARAQADLTESDKVAPVGGTPTLFWAVAEFQPLIWHGLGLLHFEAGRLDQARSYFEKVAGSGARRLLTPTPLVESLYYLARIAEKQGDAARARELDAKFLAYWGDGDLRRDWVTQRGRARGAAR